MIQTDDSNTISSIPGGGEGTGSAEFGQRCANSERRRGPCLKGSGSGGAVNPAVDGHILLPVAGQRLVDPVVTCRQFWGGDILHSHQRYRAAVLRIQTILLRSGPRSGSAFFRFKTSEGTSLYHTEKKEAGHEELTQIVSDHLSIFPPASNIISRYIFDLYNIHYFKLTPKIMIVNVINIFT